MPESQACHVMPLLLTVYRTRKEVKRLVARWKTLVLERLRLARFRIGLAIRFVLGINSLRGEEGEVGHRWCSGTLSP